MREDQSKNLRAKVKGLVIFFIFGLLISGITAFPIETQLAFGVQYTQYLPDLLRNWINLVYTGVSVTNENFPFISYGTDWLAFAHLVIAIVFIGPLKDPVKNIWVIEFGMIACVMVLPLALIAGYIREIPFFWRLIDCSFGIIGIVPLFICHRYIKQLEKLPLG
jgi:hypothetical protein